jgi:site-specific recombinase XerD
MTEADLGEIKIVPEPTEKQLTEKQLVDYRSHRKQLLKWLLHFGKEPDQAEGYSEHTIRIASYRIDKFYRWVWSDEGYTTRVTTEMGDDYLRELAYTDDSDAHKSKCLKALKMLYKWRKHQRGGKNWNPDLSFSSSGNAGNPRDYFTREERAKLREAALDYSSIPNYKSVTPEERSRWKRYLAQRSDSWNDYTV